MRVAAAVLVAAAATGVVFSKEICRTAFRLGSYALDPDVGNVEHAAASELQRSYAQKHVLVVGGTRGIGRGVAAALAAYGASVSVVGRSASGGQAVVAAMEQAAPDASQRFKAYSADLSTVKGCMAFTAALREEKLAVDHIVMTVGAWPDRAAPTTSDGIDKVIALDTYARYIIVTELAPTMPPGGRVLSVLASTSVIPNPGLEAMTRILTGAVQDPGFFSLMPTAGVAGDVMLETASRRYPGVHFIGTHPGFVLTDLTARTFPEWFNDILRAALPYTGLVSTEEEIGTITARILASPNAARRPATYFNAFFEGRRAHPAAYDRPFGDAVWNVLHDFVAKQRTL
eukprot:TRINITY_DN24621_c0_g1_i1.p1 TRINITY_DN24621_c0_g1~~TRINITY_DN24621_c0_g1_i1.p1  ORF type:complete len:344 (+),score=89.66 TRINITY_DN24621_c0_g1_i1:52-1083(+)